VEVGDVLEKSVPNVPLGNFLAPFSRISLRIADMSENPIDAIEAAIRSAFTSYPEEDDPDWRSPHWIKPEETVHLAQAILLELQTRGFEIVRSET
jgi:hypothetical protein